MDNHQHGPPGCADLIVDVVSRVAYKPGWKIRIENVCEVCGDAKTQAHHDDYSKPLIVRWLCRTHHMAHHQAERDRERAS